MAQRILRPLTFAELVDEVFDLYKKNFVLFVGITALTTAPVVLLHYFIAVTELPAIMAQMHAPISTHPYPVAHNTTMLKLFYYMIEIPFLLLMIGAMTRAVSGCYLGRRMTVIDSYTAVTPRLPALVIASILVYIVAICFCCRLNTTAIMVLIIIPQVIVLERISGIDSIKRSVDLSRFDWKKVMGITFLMMMIMLLSGPISLIGPFSLGFWQQVYHPMPLPIQAALQGIFSPLITPLYTLVMVLVYYDIRIRKEGFDLEQLTQAIGDTPSTE